ncbi:hypothetical protein DL765_003502 [Monosporascus sp. GIB2]|nr:hypothetical protein DL765_003502 [Monosporascus sp. GIB2]
MEILDLRSTQSIQGSRDLLRILNDEKRITDILDSGIFAGDNNENLKKDLTWRAQYVGQGLDFWELAKADLPWQISEGSHLNMNGPSEGVRTTELENVSQSLAMHAFFKDSYIARNPFRSFHRDDAYLVCIDELTVLEEIFTKKLDFFQRLKEDCKSLEDQDVEAGKPPENKDGESPFDRIAFAEHMMEESIAQLKRLNTDLRDSLNSNKAIFVFTGVTVIFLPLSFFTSYFGMNFKA